MTVYEHQPSLEKYRAAFSNQRKDPYSNQSAFFLPAFSLKSECLSWLPHTHMHFTGKRYPLSLSGKLLIRQASM